MAARVKQIPHPQQFEQQQQKFPQQPQPKMKQQQVAQQAFTQQQQLQAIAAKGRDKMMLYPPSPEPEPEMQAEDTMGRTAFRTNREAEKGKSIRVFLNGNDQMSGFTVALNSWNTKTFQGALGILTEKLHPEFGAVRRLFTPQGGTEICGLDDIVDGNDYVAAANEKFKPMEYRQIYSSHTRFLKNKTIVPKLEVLPNIRKTERPAKHPFIASERAKSICVVRNGDISGFGIRLVLTKRNAADLDQIMAQINTRIQLQSGALRKLYTFDGVVVSSLSDIVDGGEYVAVGRGPFIKATYNSEHIGVAQTTRRRPRMLPGTTKMPTYWQPSPRDYQEPDQAEAVNDEEQQGDEQQQPQQQLRQRQGNNDDDDQYLVPRQQDRKQFRGQRN